MMSAPKDLSLTHGSPKQGNRRFGAWIQCPRQGPSRPRMWREPRRGVSKSDRSLGSLLRPFIFELRGREDEKSLMKQSKGWGWFGPREVHERNEREWHCQGTTPKAGGCLNTSGELFQMPSPPWIILCNPHDSFVLCAWLSPFYFLFQSLFIYFERREGAERKNARQALHWDCDVGFEPTNAWDHDLSRNRESEAHLRESPKHPDDPHFIDGKM